MFKILDFIRVKFATTAFGVFFASLGIQVKNHQDSAILACLFNTFASRTNLSAFQYFCISTVSLKAYLPDSNSFALFGEDKESKLELFSEGHKGTLRH